MARGSGWSMARPDELEMAFLGSVEAARRRDPLSPVDVLVGGVLLRPYLQRLIAEQNAGMLNVRFTTLGELGTRLGERALIDRGRRPLSAMASRGYAVEVARSTNGYFGPVAHTPGFAEATRRLMRELRQEGVALGTLEHNIPSAAESEPKAQGLIDLYRRYLEGRADRYDGDDALAAAEPGLFDGTELLVYGVWHMSALGRQLLERLAQSVPVTFFLPTTAAEPDGAHQDLRDWLGSYDAENTPLDSPDDLQYCPGPSAADAVRSHAAGHAGRNGSAGLRSRPALRGARGGPDVPRLGA